MPHRLVDLRVTEISLCRHPMNPAARILLVKGGDAPPDPVAAAVAKAVADKEAEIAALHAERARADRLAKAGRWSAIGVEPVAYADRISGLPEAAVAWLDGIFDRAAAALAEADLYGERGRAAVLKAEAPIVRRARAARGSNPAA
ncbi:hypothetical protein STVA_40520 [Allostella vacuolata]|nr:hypothetical protein STVA_40520 [Stella vacuolata]